MPSGAHNARSLPLPADVLPGVAEMIQNAHVVCLPMRVRFRGIDHREAMLLRGPAGWAEFSPFPEYGDAEAARWLLSAFEAGCLGYPEPKRHRVPVNATVPAIPAARVPELLARFGPVPAVKVKVAEAGQSLDEDLARVAAVRQELPAAAVRIDANAGWDHRSAMSALSRMAEYELEYAEQPVAGITGLARLREGLAAQGIPVLIAADESVRKEADPLAVAAAGAADLIVIKAAPLAGARRALQLAADAGLPAVVSSALDTSVGIRSGVALAAALPELPYACGLGTVALFAADITVAPLQPESGYLPVREVLPDPELLARYRAAPEREAWWRQRLARCHALLSSAAE
ncbi:o-succinylbenzoate synthase [Acaricomes phytoseiuli]|uniref:o-succinylbenzoate synthase n=1 Tax=Acaricomes phytoseiuli TaxID=291968 RepID=UPI00036A72EB|nr:o-succinylbenzoate synthase [Acaricomes phytoseiuli]MCW1249835.1 o-succinylbenzoate synthase [Acaricomes phytoseiuli]